MFSKLFEERDKTVSLLVKLGDCLGRSLRENTTLFSIDSQSSQVTYLTESNKVISGVYKLDSDVTLSDIQIQDAEVFEDGEIFDGFVDKKIHSFVENIHYDEFSDAQDSFSDILSLWENRLKISTLQKNLEDKAYRLSNIEGIVESNEFQKLIEITPQLIEFLSENYEKINSVPEIKNAVNLSNAVSLAFDFPRMTHDELSESRSYVLIEGRESSIYEMICRQELVKKELVESKKSFDVIWATNASVRKLSSMIFESDERIVASLAEALREVPYLALASKKSLFETFNNCLTQSDGIGVSEKDIQAYSSKIFEIKKEAKEMFISSINEKYGVNIQNIQEPASFKSLANTQVVIFEALSRLAPRGSVLKQVLSEMGSFMKGKSGVECIDINSYLFETFTESGYEEALTEQKSMGKYTKIDFKRVAKDLGGIKDLIGTLKDKMVVDQEYSSDESLDNEALAGQEAEEGAAAAAPAEEAPPAEAPAPAPAPEAAPPGPPAEGEVPPEETPMGPGTEVPEDAAGGEEMAEVPPEEDVVSDLSDLENMVADIAAELGMDDEEETEKAEGEE
tara:strand:+ start:5626 stop:7323 length:1698 start_codon:yes stop_codon:yes gene_type:complete